MTSHDPISQAIRAAVEQYLHDLEGEPPTDGLYPMVLARVEKPLLEVALNVALGNQTRAAELLGVNRNTLRKKMKQYGLL